MLHFKNNLSLSLFKFKTTTPFEILLKIKFKKKKKKRTFLLEGNTEGLFLLFTRSPLTIHSFISTLYAHIGKMLWLCDILALDFSSWTQTAGEKIKCQRGFWAACYFLCAFTVHFIDTKCSHMFSAIMQTQESSLVLCCDSVSIQNCRLKVLLDEFKDLNFYWPVIVTVRLLSWDDLPWVESILLYQLFSFLLP